MVYQFRLVLTVPPKPLKPPTPFKPFKPKIMNKSIYTVLCAACLLGMAACQNKDYDVVAPILAPISADNIKGELVGDSYVWSWTPMDGKDMQITVIRDGQTVSSATSSNGTYTHENIQTKVPFTYVFKYSRPCAEQSP